jgi:hypothetical protein
VGYPNPECRCSSLYQGKNPWQKARASSSEPNRSGTSGRYFRVLKWLSEYGLAFEPWGREWVVVTPRSASSGATGFEAIELPRSACRVSRSRSIPCSAMVSASSRSARAAASREATIQPTAYREKMSRTTYR